MHVHACSCHGRKQSARCLGYSPARRAFQANPEPVDCKIVVHIHPVRDCVQLPHLVVRAEISIALRSRQRARLPPVRGELLARLL